MNKTTLMQQMKELQEALDVADFYLVEAVSAKSDEDIEKMIQREMKHKISVENAGRDTTEIVKRIIAIQQVLEMRNCRRVLTMLDEEAEKEQEAVGGVTLT